MARLSQFASSSAVTLCTINGRIFYKNQSGFALLGVVPKTSSSSSWVAPILVSTYSNAVRTTTNAGGDLRYNSTTTYDGKTWYVNSGQYALQGNYNPSGTFTQRVASATELLNMYYSLVTVTAGDGGTATRTMSEFSATLTATPNSGYAFVGWYKDGTLESTANPYTITVDDTVSYTAMFRADYSITLDYDSSLGEASYQWISATQVTFTASPNSNGQFVGWYVNSSNVSSSTSYTRTVSSNLTIEARFERVYSIDDRVDGDGAIQYTRGTDKNDVTFSVIPDANRHFDRYEVEKAVSSFFPNGMKSAGSVYDELTPTQAIQRIGLVDLGSLTWSYNSSSAYFTTNSISSLYKVPSSNLTVANIIDPKHTTISANDLVNGGKLGIAIRSNGTLMLKDTNYTDVNTLKSSLSSVYLYYELAEPIVNDLEIDLHYTVYEGGTEQLLPLNGSTPTTSPILADIQYPDELRENQYFTYRECPSTSGEAEITSLKGNTLVWNQLIPIPTRGTATVSGMTVTNNNDGSLTLNGTPTEMHMNWWIWGNWRTYVSIYSLKASHKYLVNDCNLYDINGAGISMQYIGDSPVIWTPSADIGLGGVRVPHAVANQTYTNVVIHPMLIDLTMAFGEGKEPTADEFVSLFSLPYYQQNNGSLLSFNGTGLKTLGRNLVNPSRLGIQSATRVRLNLFSVRVKSGDTLTFTTQNNTIQSVFAISQSETEYADNVYPPVVSGTDSGWKSNGYTYNVQYNGWVTIAFRFSTDGSITPQDVVNGNVQIQLGSASSYEPYTESTLTFGYAKQTYYTTPLSLHLNADIVITAFILDDEHFHITATTDFRYGSIYISDNDVYSGTVVTLWARPFPDYNFVQWQDGSLENPRSIVVTENITLVAVYQRVGDTNGIYQYRCYIKDQLDLEALPKSFLRVDTFNIRTDLLTNATSSITVIEMPTNVEEGDVLVLYDPKGQFLYNGVITSIEDKKIGCSQMQSFYKGSWIYSTSPQDFLEHEIATVLQDYADGELKGSSYTDQLVASRLGGITIDYTGSTTVDLPSTWNESSDSDKYEVIDMEKFIYELYEKYGIVFDFEINVAGPNYVHIRVPNFEKIKVGNNMFAIQNMLPITEIEETNKLVIYGSDKTYRTTYIATRNGIVESPSTTANRFNITNTEIVFSDDPVQDLVASNLPSQMFNHKLEYDLIIKNFIYEFGDFNLGGELDIYYGEEYYDSVLTGYEINKESNQNIIQAHFICGKVRTALTKLLTRGVI